MQCRDALRVIMTFALPLVRVPLAAKEERSERATGLRYSYNGNPYY